MGGWGDGRMGGWEEWNCDDFVRIVSGVCETLR